MLPLDHLPFPSPDLQATAAAFAALGFTVSPPAFYTDDGDGRWDTRCVFLRRGWFDLLHAPEAPANTAVAPRGALFLSHELAATIVALGDMRRLPAYRLDRHWPHSQATETFQLFSIRERIAPFGLAVIEHDWPCPDIELAWTQHANGALALSGLIFAGGEPGPFAKAAGRVLDLSGFEHWPPEAFCAAFEDVDIAVRVEVASLAAAEDALSPGLTVRRIAEGLAVVGPPPLACGFLFVEPSADAAS